MDTLSAVLVVSAAIIHATWNLLAKKAQGGSTFVWWYSAVTAVVYFPLIAWLWRDGAIGWSLPVTAAVLASGLLHLGYAVALQTGYRRADLSVVYPVARGTGPALSVAGAILLLGESFTPGILIGTGFVVTGVIAVGTGGAVAQGALLRGIRWGGIHGALHRELHSSRWLRRKDAGNLTDHA